MNKILVIIAHPDDEVLGAGGAILKHIKNGDEAYCLLLSSGITSRDSSNVEETIIMQKQIKESSKRLNLNGVFLSNLPDQKFDSVDFLSIVKEVEKYIAMIKPNIIYTHSEHDLNLDHRLTFQAVITACRPCNENNPAEIYSCEILSSTEWQLADSRFKPNVFVEIENEISGKIEAMNEYKTEVRPAPHPRSEESIRALAQYRGIQCNKRYAEAFYLVRAIS